jgi:RHS repeat-associated protein
MTMKTQRMLRPFLAALLTTGVASSALAAPFSDTLVQAPSLAQPQRGSLAGSLSKLAYGASDLARGSFQLPLAVEVPEQRGPILTHVFPSYSAENGLSEWGMGWSVDLSIRRHRILGDLQYDETDGYVSPWGRLVPGSDGAYYPAGLRSKVRVVLGADGGFTATTEDGTVFTFAAADTVAGNGGTYAWMLTRVDSILGDSARLTYVTNASGRKFLGRITWGGRLGTPQYEAELVYTVLDQPGDRTFPSYASGRMLVLDRRVKQVIVRARRDGGAMTERWHYDLGYSPGLYGPAFYLTSLTRTFASGQSEPPARYEYDLGAEYLSTAQVQVEPALDGYLHDNGAAAIQPDHASATDVEQDGLIDLENRDAFQLVRRTTTGFEKVDLDPNPNANPMCRSTEAASLHKPRVLARMQENLEAPQVVAVSSNGLRSQVLLCDRLGTTLSNSTVDGDWHLGATTRLADMNGDRRPDIVKVWNGNVQVLWNISAGATWYFQPGLVHKLSPTATTTPGTLWVLDFNGDSKPDLVTRTGNTLVVWYGVGGGEFDPSSKVMAFRSTAGLPIGDLGTYQMTHGDLNGDGLSDVVLSKTGLVSVYMNLGDQFAQRAIPGLTTVPASYGPPIVADLTGSGDPQVAFIDGTRAKTIALATARTGLLRRADDGKGTVIELGYQRVAPQPGIVHRYSLLGSMTVASTGHGTASYVYTYERPIWHSVGRFLVGFGRATKISPRLTQDVDFLNDDDVSGVVLATSDRDATSPLLEQFTRNELEPASYLGVPFQRPVASESGQRLVGSAQELATRVDFEAYERGTCPVRTSTTLPGAVLTHEQTLATGIGLDDRLHCRAASESYVGVHADPSLDFSHAARIERDGQGQVTRVVQLGGEGEWTLQENQYGADARLAASGSPGHGSTRLVYDALGRLTQVIAADGSVTRASGIDPITDALTEMRDERGGVSATHGLAYDGLERLARLWTDLTGSSAALPAETIAYRYASAGQPGALDVSTLVDASTGVRRREVTYQAADGETLGTATWADGWQLGPLVRDDRAEVVRAQLDHPPIAGAEGALALTLDQLYASAGVELARQEKGGSGRLLRVETQHQEGARGVAETRVELRAVELVEVTTENGQFVRELGKDARGRVIRRRDELGVEQRYRYDALDRLVEITTPDGKHALRFDGYGRPARIVRDGVATIDYAYDASGRVTTRRVRDGAGALVRTETTGYDALGRPTLHHHTRADGSTRDVSLSYDGVGAADGGGDEPGQLGRLTRVRVPGLDRRDRYDAEGRLVRSVFRLADGWRELVQTVAYRADGKPGRTQLVVKNGAGATLESLALTTEVDAFGRQSRALLGGVELYRTTWDARGRLARADFADGHVLSCSYDPVTGRRSGYTFEGPTQHARVRWSLDARGHVASEVLAGAVAASTRSYSYSSRGELLDAFESKDDGQGGAPVRALIARHAYVASGLLDTVEDLLGFRHVRPDGTTGAAGGVSYEWDAQGRVVRRGDTRLEYGPDGELLFAHRPGRVVRYDHDETGHRVLKSVDGVPVRADVAGGVLTEAGLVMPVELDGIVVGVIEHGVFRAQATDARGTPISDVDGTSNLATPYGVRAHHGSLAETLDFTRLGWDADLDTVRMGQRDYDARLGRFWTPDPQYLEDLDRCAGNPAACNLFAYAAADPLRFTDPSGREPKAALSRDNPVDCTPGAAKPGSGPTSMPERLGHWSYYDARAADFKARHPDQAPPDYYMNYGTKYAERFTDQLNPRLSDEGKAWLTRARYLLQEEMERYVINDPKGFDKLEQNNDAFREWAYTSHVRAYVDAGLGDLPVQDLWRIVSTPDMKELWDGRGQIVDTIGALHSGDSFWGRYLNGSAFLDYTPANY